MMLIARSTRTYFDSKPEPFTFRIKDNAAQSPSLSFNVNQTMYSYYSNTASESFRHIPHAITVESYVFFIHLPLMLSDYKKDA